METRLYRLRIATLSFSTDVVMARRSSQGIDELEEFIEFAGDNEFFCCEVYLVYENQVRNPDYADLSSFLIMFWISFADCNGCMPGSSSIDDLIRGLGLARLRPDVGSPGGFSQGRR
jgi:hypothetical protein